MIDGADGLRVLGWDARSGRPLPPLPFEQARERARRQLGRARPPRYGVRSGDLASAGWGVVFPDGDDRGEAKRALEPLLRRRRRQAGERYVEFETRLEQTASSWRQALFTAHGRADPRRIPWYLLVVGDAEAVPFGFEHDLGPSYAVGRLDLDADDLAAYAEKVCAHERRADGGLGRAAPAVGVFAPSHDHDVSTRLAVEHFARPLAELVARRGGGDARLDAALGRGADRRRLEAMIAASPRLLITAAHGLCYRPGDRLQRSRQGGIVCADWPGPQPAPRPAEEHEALIADDLPTGALAGGVALLLGCFTAGTPRVDLYDTVDLDAAERWTSTPFSSAIAHRLLGRRGGALGVVGHVGRAFEAGFYWRGVRQSASFEDALAALLDGRRLGEALDGLGQRHADLAVAWTRPQVDRDAPEPDPLDLWVAMNDACSWTLLGDPAVRPILR